MRRYPDTRPPMPKRPANGLKSPLWFRFFAGFVAVHAGFV